MPEGWLNNTRLLLILFVAGLVGGCVQRSERIITFHESGEVEVVSMMAISRELVEQELAQQAQKQQDAAKAADEKEPEPVQADDVALRKTIAEYITQRFANESQTISAEDITLREKEVEIRLKSHFKDFSEFMASSVSQLDNLGRLHLDKSEAGEFVVRGGLAAGREIPPAQIIAAAQRLHMQKTAFKARFILPGKVISTTLPEQEENATWVEYDCADMEQARKLVKLQVDGFEIVAEPGKMNLSSLPIDSQEIYRLQVRKREERQNRVFYELPLQPANEGLIIIQPLSSSFSISFPLPEGKALLDEERHFATRENNHCAMQLQINAAPGSNLIRLLDMKVSEASDDQNRALRQGHTYSSNSTPSAVKGIQQHLNFVNPPLDTRAIEVLRLTGEAVIAKSWKIMPLPDPKEGKEYDLGQILPGAKLKITGYNMQNQNRGRSLNCQLNYTITGGPGVAAISLRIVTDGKPNHESENNHFNIQVSNEDNFTVTGNTSRYLYFSNENAMMANLRFEAAFPVNMERVAFDVTLEGLDFY